MTINPGWKFAAVGALGGAAIVFAASALGVMPVQPREAMADSTVHTYLMSHPEVLIDMTNLLQAKQDAKETRERQAAVEKAGLNKFFNPQVAFITGPANAKRTFVEFFDYNCPYCRASIPAVQAYYDAHKNDTRFAFIEFPIKGQNSTEASRAAIAARKQPDKYLAFHFALMNEQEMVTPELVMAVAKKTGLDIAKLEADMNDPVINKEIDAAHALADQAGIDGTPTFIVNGHVRPGAIDAKELAELMKPRAG